MFKRDDWMFGILSIVVAVVAMIAVSDMEGIKTMDPAGPAALPKIVAWIMIGIGVMHIIGSLAVIKRGAADEAKKKKKNNVPVVLICAASLLYYLLLEPVGYPLLTPLLILAVMASVGERKIGKMLAISFGTAFALFAIFHYGLGVNMPLGILEPLLY